MAAETTYLSYLIGAIAPPRLHRCNFFSDILDDSNMSNSRILREFRLQINYILSLCRTIIWTHLKATYAYFRQIVDSS